MFKNIKYQIKRAKQTMLFQCLSLQNNIVDSRILRKSKGLKSENAEISRLYIGGLGEFPHVSVKVLPARPCAERRILPFRKRNMQG